MEGLAKHTIYNASSRNYGAYNATIKTQDGEFYTTFFTMERQRGSWDGQRHRFMVTVESAYFDPQLGHNKRVTLAGVFAKLN
ncbi:hypothetical protein [Rhizobium sp. BK060]|uniref:hypothetical protein n=1 Tax=Rhizobium sp. BK060 TaxID=2587096 RepID=UPI00161889CE|nr:hypothetical protein [Rhizobium sp. BK060]MBB3395509.1 hypothetical protein [Rhizobium sp. BK060]